MSGRIELPPECASRAELWAWIERHAVLIEALNRADDEIADLASAWRLSPCEREMFRLLWLRRGRTVTSEQLAALVGVRNPDADAPELVRAMICRLRGKLKGTGLRVATVWAQGYRLEREEAAQARGAGRCISAFGLNAPCAGNAGAG